MKIQLQETRNGSPWAGATVSILADNEVNTVQLWGSEGLRFRNLNQINEWLTGCTGPGVVREVDIGKGWVTTNRLFQVGGIVFTSETQFPRSPREETRLLGTKVEELSADLGRTDEAVEEVEGRIAEVEEEIDQLQQDMDDLRARLEDVESS